MDNPVFSADSAGFWIWRSDLFYSDRTFPSEDDAIDNYKRLLEVYTNSEVVK
ncbi:MAG: hypothetical protein AAFV85_23260 [Cyanobacteria bacterium J06634_6]